MSEMPDIPPELQFPKQPPTIWDFINYVWALEWQAAGMTIPDDPFSDEGTRP